MHALERILVYTRGATPDDPAVSRAIAIARRWGGRIRLMDVFAELPPGWEPLLASLDMGDAREEAERERRGELGKIADHLHALGIHADTDLHWGRPVVEVVRAAVQGRYQVVVLADDHARGVSGPVWAILRECPAPVWVVKPVVHARPARVLAAVAPVGPEPAELDRRILASAHAASDTMGGELHVVHAWQPIHEAIEWLPEGMRLHAQKARALREARERHERWVQGMVAAAWPHHPRERTHLVEGAPSEAVLRVADEIGADLVVFGTARSPDHPGMYVGTTAEAIIEHARVSIIAIKPEGFAPSVS
jgi:nucleotide-binding universal stress UspA family protein